MKIRIAAIMLSGIAVLVLAPATRARGRPAGPTASVGTIDCSSAPQMTQMAISYFKAGSKLNPTTATGAGLPAASFTPVFEIHAPLGSASEWGQALSNGTQFSSCTISVTGENGPETLTFSHLMIASVLSIGQRADDSPLPDYYTDVVFTVGSTGSPTLGGWDISKIP